MYSLSMPVSTIRTKVREQFERHRYVNQLPVVDMLLFQSHSEYQVGETAHHTEYGKGRRWIEAPPEEKAVYHACKRRGG